MRISKSLILIICIFTFLQGGANGKIIIENKILPTCVGGSEAELQEKWERGKLLLDFEDIKHWDNCYAVLMMNNYFDKLSDYTNTPKPHSRSGFVLMYSQFKNGLPNGRASAMITTEIDEDKFFALSLEEQEEFMLDNIFDTIFRNDYMGNLENGLPEGYGVLTYTAGFLDFHPRIIRGEWAVGCIDWDKEVRYDTTELSFTYKPSIIKDKYTIKLEHHPIDVDEVDDVNIIERVESYLKSCVPGLARGNKSFFN